MPDEKDRENLHSSRRVEKRKGVEKQWRKGTSRWRFSGDPEDDRGDGLRKQSPRRFAVAQRENERDALVIQTGGPLVLLQDGDEEIRARPRRNTSSENPGSTLVAIGDRVRYTQIGDGDSHITHVYKRSTELTRSAVQKQGFEQVLAANVEQIVIVAAVTEELFRPGLIDRYLIASAMGGMTPVICFNKIDLLDDEEEAFVKEVGDVYEAVGYRVFYTSCVTGEGIGELQNHLKGAISVFSGHSGVGKTSLLKRLLPATDAKVQELSEQSRRGTHATTMSTLHELAAGGYIVDTPGIREFGLSRFDRNDLHRYYPEFLPFADACKFPSCIHVHEPGCAVIQAMESGAINPMRYRNYLQILSSE